jgi:hypothetical protein
MCGLKTSIYVYKVLVLTVKMLINKQVGAPTAPSAIIRESNEFEDFRCHRGVIVSQNDSVCRIYLIFQLAYF